MTLQLCLESLHMDFRTHGWRTTLSMFYNDTIPVDQRAKRFATASKSTIRTTHPTTWTPWPRHVPPCSLLHESGNKSRSVLASYARRRVDIGADRGHRGPFVDRTALKWRSMALSGPFLLR
ncbi:hypothetical protein NXS13_02395 [Corynebacterium sp. ES2730-CONJ]|uniref:hypothetical protein n=1 Tax=unclassified Corynebacterium TaxID=2624378 RepID=UPI00216AFC4D|nr:MULTISPECIES: hypothetical protein [unclassified Corynebacterium]MCS4531356.1 hypothetical protein [Corynebacterium sp. ES2730-CONJ]